ncbi:hypothetical protein GCK32_020987 [Trichostrongylus colubriformis]|uniref:CCHC-type domain-containing protein n=1 Tax=Trichostrongylus colubriformis TaxID=6319 RepID=A0AAN8FLN9_TRICO
MPSGRIELSNELRRAKLELKRLKAAIPPLPTPEDLYNDIVHSHTEVMYLTELIDNVKSDITFFFDSNESWKVLERDARIKELSVENYNLRLRLLRKHLSLLFSTIPIMIAKKVTSAKAWQTQMLTQQYYTNQSGAKVPLPMSQGDIGRIMNDYEETIQELFMKMKDIRSECLHHERNRQDVSNKRICDSIQSLREEVSQLREELQQREDEPAKKMRKSSQENMDTSTISEQAKITDNAEFMETVQEELESEKMEHSGEAPPLADDPQDEAQGSQENGEEELLQNIKNLEEQLNDVHQKIRELSRMRTCQPRQYEAGVYRLQESKMPCAFCGTLGAHYSDSCSRVRTVQERREFLRNQKRCTICLERECERGYHCPKYSRRCHHCKQTGHASAMCELPEKSLQINAQKAHYEAMADNILKSLEDLRRSAHI